MRVPTRRGDYKKPKADPYLTEAKVKELKDKLDHLKKVTRLKLMKEVAILASQGDFSENAAYQIAKGKLRGVNQAILEFEDHLKQAIIIGKEKNNNKVCLGSRVTIEMDGKIKTWLILGSSEVDLSKNIISHNSPLGSVLMNKKVGEAFKVKLKDKSLNCRVLSLD